MTQMKEATMVNAEIVPTEQPALSPAFWLKERITISILKHEFLNKTEVCQTNLNMVSNVKEITNRS